MYFDRLCLGFFFFSFQYSVVFKLFPIDKTHLKL